MSFIFGFAVGAWSLLIFSLLCKDDERDSTDGLHKRSGMKIHTDHLTGLQYLGTGRGGLTPRLDQNGAQMRAEDDQ